MVLTEVCGEQVTSVTDQCCLGVPTADPTPVTDVDLGRPCEDTVDANLGIPACVQHAALITGAAATLTACPVCGDISALCFVDRHPAR